MSSLKQLRLSAGYTHQDMANKLNISKTFYWQIESKKRRLSYQMAINIAYIFGKKPDEIFYRDYKNKEF
ncbi:MAG: helix-turn-helix transcriptional regulator [Bacilli bacterium]|jgi:putative transcriptional regulator|nr:helix-turn-helix transcriptional regulator [Bacilli bacterium]